MIKLHVLGHPDVTRDGVSLPIQRKPLALLAYLALSSQGEFVQRDTLLGVFWPDFDQSRARGALRQALHTLRRTLGEDVLKTQGDDRVAFNGDVVRCDALEFQRAIQEGQLRDAVDQYRGHIFRGVHLRDCSEFEHWLDGQRALLEQSYELAIEGLVDTARSKGDHRLAAHWLRQLLQVDPLQGRVVALLMEELEACGDREQAIIEGEQHSSRVKRELDAAPDSRVNDLLVRMRTAPRVVANRPRSRGASTECSLDSVREALSDRYDMLEEFGGGTLTKVFLAWDPKLRRHVVLKVLKPETRALVGADRFLQEIALVARFNHPNIVPLYEAGEVGALLYYAMRYIPGKALNELIRRAGYLPIDVAIRITCDVACGLEYAHEQNVIHRDVKPRNVLLHETVALIADFTTALAIAGGGRRLTESGVLVGTPEYMSPEQADPNAKIDRRSDVYGLGCVLYQMVTGEPVFSGATMHAILAKHRAEAVPSVRITRPDAPAELDRVIGRSLAKIPGKRYPSAAALAHALRQL